MMDASDATYNASSKLSFVNVLFPRLPNVNYFLYFVGDHTSIFIIES